MEVDLRKNAIVQGLVKARMKVKLKDDIKFMKESFPKRFEKDIEAIAVNFKYERFGYHNTTESIKLNDEVIILPSRIYYEELSNDELDQLTESQQRLVWCYYLRHNNGYIRQKYLIKILQSGTIFEHEIPYIVSEIGSYVYEIIKDIYCHFGLLVESGLEKFITNNEKYAKKTWGRIASYWGEYYQSIPKRDYCGFKMQKYFGCVVKKVNRG